MHFPFTVFNEAEVFLSEITLNGERFAIEKGKHEIWVPSKEMKIIWSFNGQIESYMDWEKGRNAESIHNRTLNSATKGFNKAAKESILNEYALFEELHRREISPKPRGLFFIRIVNHDMFSKGWYPSFSDCAGMYGIFLEDANKLPKNKNTIRKIDQFLKENVVVASERVRGDLLKESNLVNGYLVDVRRTIWDMMVYKNNYYIAEDLPVHVIDGQALMAQVGKECQFPYGEREHNYQSFLLNGDYKEGSRDTLYRFDRMGLPEDMSGLSVLDLGCNLGAFCLESYKRGARDIMGVDIFPIYIKSARDIAAYNGFCINYQPFNIVGQRTQFIKTLQLLFPRKIKIVFALSLYSHIREKLWDVLSSFGWETCYVESSNAPEGFEQPSVVKMEAQMKKLWKVERIGMTEDRSPRCVWRIS